MQTRWNGYSGRKQGDKSGEVKSFQRNSKGRRAILLLNVSGKAITLTRGGGKKGGTKNEKDQLTLVANERTGNPCVRYVEFGGESRSSAKILKRSRNGGTVESSL